MINESKLRKLLALATNGVGGERDNAQAKLDQLLKENGLTIANLLDEHTDLVWFKWKRVPFGRELLNQVAGSVVGRERTFWRTRDKRQVLGVEVTPEERLEIELRYEIYVESLKKELKTAYSAFVHVNEIFPPESDDDGPSEPLSEEDLERLLHFMGGMEKTPVHKQIGGGS